MGLACNAYAGRFKKSPHNELHPKKLDIHPTFGVFFMAKYDESYKLEVVQGYEQGQHGSEHWPRLTVSTKRQCDVG